MPTKCRTCKDICTCGIDDLCRQLAERLAGAGRRGEYPVGGYSRNPVQNSRISEAVEDGMELPFSPEMLLSDLRLTADIDEIDTLQVGAVTVTQFTSDIAAPAGAWVDWTWLENADPIMSFQDPTNMRLDSVGYIGLDRVPTNTKKWRHFLSVGCVNDDNIVDDNLVAIVICKDDRLTMWPYHTEVLNGDAHQRIDWRGGAIAPYHRLMMRRYFHVNQGATYYIYGWMIYLESYQPPGSMPMTVTVQQTDATSIMWPGPV